MRTIEPDGGAARSATALAVSGLWKVFGASRAEFARANGPALSSDEMARRGWVAAIRDAGFEIRTGEVFVIMGLSGSGKSTLVRCLTRLHEPTAGRVEVQGRDILAASATELAELRRRAMGMVFQNFALLPNRSVLGNVAFPLEVQGVARPAREARARALIELVGLSGREGRMPSELSGGQQQRVGIARSLATDPALWFLDEPFSALDPLIRADLQDELMRLQATLAKTIVFITHDLDEAIRIADRIAIMEAGRIVQIGAPEDLVLRPAGPYVARFTARIPAAKVVRVEALIEPGLAPAEAAPTLRAGDRVADVAAGLLDADGPFAVLGVGGVRLGAVSKRALVSVLAGRRPDGPTA